MNKLLNGTFYSYFFQEITSYDKALSIDQKY